MGLEVLTLYAFSSENWKRPESEVGDLMGLLRHFIQADLAEFEANDVRLRVIVNLKALEPSLVALIVNAISRTAPTRSSTVVVPLHFVAQAELTPAQQMLARKVAAGELSPNSIRPADLA